jgi:uncharacterized protein YndB with AHSA1/START domain
MGVQDVDVTARSSASPEEVFAVLLDAERWPEWSPVGKAELREEGAPDRNGVGALRVFTTGRVSSFERVVEADRPRRFSYVLEQGLPLTGYRADVDLTPTDGGTAIRWHSTFRAKVPGTGWFYRLVLTRFIRTTATRLAEAANATV